MADDDDKGKPDDILEEAQEAFKLAADYENQNREAAKEDLRFGRLGEQWEQKAINSRGADRPCLTINKMPAFIRQVVNDARQNKPSIKCHPADSKADPETALILNGLIRNIEYASSADVAYDTGAESAVCGGFGYWRILTDYSNERSFDLDIRITAVPNPLLVYGDPHSKAADSADWNSAFVTELMEKDAFEAKYKGAEAVDWKGADYAGLKSPWMEGEKVLTAEWWKREEKPTKLLLLTGGMTMLEDEYKPRKDLFEAMGLTVIKERPTTTQQVKQYIMTGAEVLETNDWAGKYIPIVPVYGEDVNVDGQRYLRSLIRDAKDAQRMFNYWRTTTTELVALAPRAPWIGRKGAFVTDEKKWATANTTNHPYLQFDGPDMPTRQPFDGPPAGALQEALNASDDMKAVMGIYDASLGARSNETSGKAIMARQREGDVSTFHFIDNVRRSIRHTGRILLDLIPKIYTGERIIRVLGQDGKTPQNVQLGELREQPPAQAQQPGQAQGQPQMGPNGQAEDPVQRIYDLGLGEYDITVETGPSFTTQREEQSNMIIEMVRAYPAIAPLVMDILASNQDWPGADEIAQRMKAMLPPQIKGQDPRMAQMMQEGQKLVAENAALKQDKGIEQQKLNVDRYNAETDRWKALGIPPEQFPMVLSQLVQQMLATPLVPGAPMQQPMGQPMPGGPMPQPPMPMPMQNAQGMPQGPPPGPPNGGMPTTPFPTLP